MSDDEESMTASLRRLQISIPHLRNQQQEKGDQESSDKTHETQTGKHQHPVITKTRHKETPAKLSQSLPQQFGSSTPLPSCSHDIDEYTKTWFRREVRELKRELKRKLAKYSRDSRRIHRDMKEDTERVCTQNVKEPNELPCEKVDRAVIRDLSQVLVLWTWPARSLGLEDSDIATIQLDNPGDTREQSYKMLHTWVQRCGQSATYQTLGRVLLTEASGVYPRYVEIVSKYCS
jgi:hypothetical protein